MSKKKEVLPVPRFELQSREDGGSSAIVISYHFRNGEETAWSMGLISRDRIMSFAKSLNIPVYEHVLQLVKVQ